MNHLFLKTTAAAMLLGIGFTAVTPGPILADESPALSTTSAPRVAAGSMIAAGQYLVTIGGCNDCHTGDWAETNGDVPVQDWLTGSPIGWRGPWGTTYASNLRLLVRDMSEDAWVTMLKTRADRPPMPWMNVNRLDDNDARAIYRFIASLGVRGERMPAALGPDVEPKTPYFLLEPQPPRRLAAAAAGQDENH